MSVDKIKITDYYDRDGHFIIVKKGEEWLKCYSYSPKSRYGSKFSALRQAINYVAKLNIKPVEKTLREYEIY